MNEVVVTAPARLHFGMLDPADLGTRRFGGFGVGVQRPRTVVAVRTVSSPGSEEVAASGPEAERAAVFARRARAAFGLRDAVAVDVRETIPAHSGLGSGTKLGLAIARAVAELAGVSPSAQELASASGRGARSSVGCWTFVGPGLVVEAGVSAGQELSPLLGRYPMPADWRCVLALPHGVEGLSGDAEARFFAGLRRPAGNEPQIARLLLTALLPGLLAADIDEFGTALTEIQREVGAVFAERQGGVFHPRSGPLVAELASLGVKAVGQSSWGPTVYGIVDAPDVASDVAARLRAAAGSETEVAVVDFDRAGATVSTRETGVVA